MQIRPHPVPHDGSNPTNSAEDHAIRHVNSIMYILPEVRKAVTDKKASGSVQMIASPITEHVDGLKDLKTRLKNMDAQLSVQTLKESFERFQKTPSEENLTTIAREAYQLGSQLNIPGCHVASHVEEIRVATHVLVSAVKKGDQETVQNQRHVIHMLIKNLISLSPEHGLHKDVLQLNQNHTLFRTISDPTHEEVLEWQKALNEFPPVT
jgi:hypothetical protein